MDEAKTRIIGVTKKNLSADLYKLSLAKIYPSLRTSLDGVRGSKILQNCCDVIYACPLTYFLLKNCLSESPDIFEWSEGVKNSATLQWRHLNMSSDFFFFFWTGLSTIGCGDGSDLHLDLFMGRSESPIFSSGVNFINFLRARFFVWNFWRQNFIRKTRA